MLRRLAKVFKAVALELLEGAYQTVVMIAAIVFVLLAAVYFQFNPVAVFLSVMVAGFGVVVTNRLMREGSSGRETRGFEVIHPKTTQPADPKEPSP